MTALLCYRLSFYWVFNCRITTHYPNQLIFRALCIFTSYVPSMLHSRLIFHYVFLLESHCCRWVFNIPHEVCARYFMEKVLLPRGTQAKHSNILSLHVYCRKEHTLPSRASRLASPPHQPWHKPQHWNTVAEYDVSGTEAFIPQQNTDLFEQHDYNSRRISTRERGKEK